jgi:hypothetical protein
VVNRTLLLNPQCSWHSSNFCFSIKCANMNDRPLFHHALSRAAELQGVRVTLIPSPDGMIRVYQQARHSSSF